MSKLSRQSHRWISPLSVAANFATMALCQPPLWLVYAPLPPLFLSLCCGLYTTYALPCITRARGAPVA